jgi:thymidine phosphorylase
MVGETVAWLGAGRGPERAEIDHAVGVMLHAKVGDEVAAGDPLGTVHANDERRGLEAGRRLTGAYTIGDPSADSAASGTLH